MTKQQTSAERERRLAKRRRREREQREEFRAELDAFKQRQADHLRGEWLIFQLYSPAIR